MEFEKVDLSQLVTAITALLTAAGVIFTAWQANKVKNTVKTIEASVNGAATKAQEVINDLRRQLNREKEISQEKTQVAAVLQASGSGQHVIPQQQQPIKAEIVNEEPVQVQIKEKDA